MGYAPLTWSLLPNVFFERSYKVSSWSITRHNEDLLWKSWPCRSLRHSYRFGGFPHNLEKDENKTIMAYIRLGLHSLQDLNCGHILMGIICLIIKINVIYTIYVYKVIFPIMDVWNVIWTWEVLQHRCFLPKVQNRRSIVFRVPFQGVLMHRQFYRVNRSRDYWIL